MLLRTRRWAWCGLAILTSACASGGTELEDTRPDQGTGGADTSMGGGGGNGGGGGEQGGGGGGSGGQNQDWDVLFDGTLGDDWKMSTITNQPGMDDPGHFEVSDGALVAMP